MGLINQKCFKKVNTSEFLTIRKKLQADKISDSEFQLIRVSYKKMCMTKL